jgi:peptide/nickel transport system ATP-binding protein
MSSLLEIEDLRVEFAGRSLVSGVSLQVDRGETVAIVGESGSGKTLTARAIIRLLPTGVEATAQRMTLGGENVLGLSERAAARLRGNRITMIFQDPFTMLNPVMRCGTHLEEVLRNRLNPVRGGEARTEAVRRLAEVGINDPGAIDRYPFQLSGGMRQRVGLAAALAGDPELLIADEPSTALDVTTQAEILELLKDVQQARGMGMILITHDLRVAFSVADRIYVLYAGALVEVSRAQALQAEPLHPYSLGLLLSEPASEFKQAQLLAIDGSVPAPDEVVDCCSFASRCRWAMPICIDGQPPLREPEPARFTACVRLEEIRAEMTEVRREVRTPLLEVVPEGEPEVRFLDVRNLSKVFAGQRGGAVRALNGIDVVVGANESVGIVGESGSGKTTLGRCLVGLEKPSGGTIEIDGIDASDYSKLSRAERARLRRTVQIVFQDPYSSLDRTETVGAALKEVLVVNRFPSDRINARTDELLERVGLPLGYAKRRPAALSGGERQRVVIARTLAMEPKLIVCDEPVSALDVSVQAQILNLFRELRAEFGLSYLFITHDLAVVRQVVDRVYVLYQGDVVEQGMVDQVLDQPQHSYTKRLISSIPSAAA